MNIVLFFLYEFSLQGFVGDSHEGPLMTRKNPIFR
jgi:hypothetical protein